MLPLKVRILDASLLHKVIVIFHLFLSQFAVVDFDFGVILQNAINTKTLNASIFTSTFVKKETSHAKSRHKRRTKLLFFEILEKGSG